LGRFFRDEYSRDQLEWNDVISKTGINWADLETLTMSGVNWTDLGTLSSTGINWRTSTF